MTPIPIWIHTIWLQKNKPQVCKTLHRDGEALQDLIEEYGEQTVQFAWALYVTEDPSPYHLEPVKVAVKATSKNGKEWIDAVEDGSSITRFPLAAFLKVNEAYIANAIIAIAEIKQCEDQRKYNGAYGDAFEVWLQGKRAAKQ